MHFTEPSHKFDLTLPLREPISWDLAGLKEYLTTEAPYLTLENVTFSERVEVELDRMEITITPASLARDDLEAWEAERLQLAAAANPACLFTIHTCFSCDFWKMAGALLRFFEQCADEGWGDTPLHENVIEPVWFAGGTCTWQELRSWLDQPFSVKHLVHLRQWHQPHRARYDYCLGSGQADFARLKEGSNAPEWLLFFWEGKDRDRPYAPPETLCQTARAALRQLPDLQVAEITDGTDSVFFQRLFSGEQGADWLALETTALINPLKPLVWAWQEGIWQLRNEQNRLWDERGGFHPLLAASCRESDFLVSVAQLDTYLPGSDALDVSWGSNLNYRTPTSEHVFRHLEEAMAQTGQTCTSPLATIDLYCGNAWDEQENEYDISAEALRRSAQDLVWAEIKKAVASCIPEGVEPLGSYVGKRGKGKHFFPYGYYFRLTQSALAALLDTGIVHAMGVRDIPRGIDTQEILDFLEEEYSATEKPDSLQQRLQQRLGTRFHLAFHGGWVDFAEFTDQAHFSNYLAGRVTTAAAVLLNPEMPGLPRTNFLHQLCARMRRMQKGGLFFNLDRSASEQERVAVAMVQADSCEEECKATGDYCEISLELREKSGGSRQSAVVSRWAVSP